MSVFHNLFNKFVNRKFRMLEFPGQVLELSMPVGGNGSFRPLSRSPLVVRPESFRPRVVSPSYPESFRPLFDESFRPLSKFLFIEAIVINLQFLFPSFKLTS